VERTLRAAAAGASRSLRGGGDSSILDGRFVGAALGMLDEADLVVWPGSEGGFDRTRLRHLVWELLAGPIGAASGLRVDSQQQGFELASAEDSLRARGRPLGL
jgi:hypothetical protein